MCHGRFDEVHTRKRTKVSGHELPVVPRASRFLGFLGLQETVRKEVVKGNDKVLVQVINVRVSWTLVGLKLPKNARSSLVVTRFCVSNVPKDFQALSLSE